MQITGIKIRKITNDEKMKAIISVTFDNCLAVHDIKVIKGQERLFVAMPSRKAPDGKFVDIVHPITQEMRVEMEEEILKAYYEAVENIQNGGPAAEEGNEEAKSETTEE